MSFACKLNQQWCHVLTLCTGCKAEHPQQQLIETTKKSLNKAFRIWFWDLVPMHSCTAPNCKATKKLVCGGRKNIHCCLSLSYTISVKPAPSNLTQWSTCQNLYLSFCEVVLKTQWVLWRPDNFFPLESLKQQRVIKCCTWEHAHFAEMKNQGEEKSKVTRINSWALGTVTASYSKVGKGLIKGPQLLVTIAGGAFLLAWFGEAWCWKTSGGSAHWWWRMSGNTDCFLLEEGELLFQRVTSTSPNCRHHYCPCPGASHGQWVECVTHSVGGVTSDEDAVTCVNIQILQECETFTWEVLSCLCLKHRNQNKRKSYPCFTNLCRLGKRYNTVYQAPVS